jgi:hypothetical protein
VRAHDQKLHDDEAANKKAKGRRQKNVGSGEKGHAIRYWCETAITGQEEWTHLHSHL